MGGGNRVPTFRVQQIPHRTPDPVRVQTAKHNLNHNKVSQPARPVHTPPPQISTEKPYQKMTPMQKAFFFTSKVAEVVHSYIAK